jgi:hypothetical protein
MIVGTERDQRFAPPSTKTPPHIVQARHRSTSLPRSTHVTPDSGLSFSFYTDHTMPSFGVLLVFLTSCVVLYTGWDWGLRGGQSPLQSSKRPNIVFILTDDQDLHMNSLEYMPHTRKLIADQGTTFSNHFCTNALCCPSRVTIWTGLSPHNTNVTDVNPPHGVSIYIISQDKLFV